MLFLKSFLRAFIPVTKSIIFVDTTTFATNSAKKGFNDPNNSIPCSNCKSWNLKMRNWNRRTARSRVSCQSWRARPARQFQPHLGRSTESSPRWCVCVCVCLWCPSDLNTSFVCDVPQQPLESESLCVSFVKARFLKFSLLPSQSMFLKPISSFF